jgi:hypothetical protein
LANRGAPVPADLARSNRLPVIAATINDHAAAADAATRRGLEHAVAVGLLLLEAKGLVDHGGWIPWLEANCRVGARQAQTFMRLARNRHRLEAIKNESAAAYLTIAAAEALVGRPRPERPRGLPGQLDMLGGEDVIADPVSERGEVGRLRATISRLWNENAQLVRAKQGSLAPASAREASALIGLVATWLHNWSVADERRRFKIIQIIEHAGRLIEQHAHEISDRERAR